MKVVLTRIASWMRVSHPHPENVMAPISLGYAAAEARRRGHGALILDTELGGWTFESLKRTILEECPDLLVVESLTPSWDGVRMLARDLRDDGMKAGILAVGQQASCDPDGLVGTGIDAAAIDEFDRTVADVADALEGHRGLDAVPGLYLLAERLSPVRTADRPFIQDLDSLPMPPHAELVPRPYRVHHPVGVPRRLRWGFILSSRGCPYRCVYCSPTLRNSFHRNLRTRSAASVIEELRVLRSVGATVVHFKDDTFTLDRGRVEELCEQMIRQDVRLPFTVQTRCDAVDEPLLRLMARAGLRTVSLGVESGSPRILDLMEKGETVSQARAAFAAAHAAGVRTVGYFMLGFPSETREEMQATLDLCRDLQPDVVQVAFFTPYPGSPAWEQLVGPDASRESKRPFAHHYNADATWSSVDPAEIRAMQRRFYLGYMLSPRVHLRYLARKGLVCQVLNADIELDFYWKSFRFLLAGITGRHS